MPNQPIPVNTATQMIESYRTYMENHGIDMNQQTVSVSFTNESLSVWLAEVQPYMDELRIFNGLYDSGTHAERTTVILWPYRSGQPATWPEESQGEGYIEPFNDGQLKP